MKTNFYGETKIMGEKWESGKIGFVYDYFTN